MLEQQKRDTIRGDFEKYMRYVLDNRIDFNLEVLVSFASSLINFYAGSNIIDHAEKNDAALYIVQLFNGGLSQKISEEDIDKLKDLILEDQTIDYQLLSPVFS